MGAKGCSIFFLFVYKLFHLFLIIFFFSVHTQLNAGGLDDQLRLYPVELEQRKNGSKRLCKVIFLMKKRRCKEPQMDTLWTLDISNSKDERTKNRDGYLGFTTMSVG